MMISPKRAFEWPDERLRHKVALGQLVAFGEFIDGHTRSKYIQRHQHARAIIGMDAQSHEDLQ
jgi:hypothetical protein